MAPAHPVMGGLTQGNSWPCLSSVLRGVQDRAGKGPAEAWRPSRHHQVPPHLRLPLEDDNPATLVACGQQLSGVVELNSRDDIGCGGRDRKVWLIRTPVRQSSTEQAPYPPEPASLGWATTQKQGPEGSGALTRGRWSPCPSRLARGHRPVHRLAFLSVLLPSFLLLLLPEAVWGFHVLIR